MPFLRYALLLLLFATGSASKSSPASIEEFGTPDSVIKALYDVISGAAGQKRDWDRFNKLFAPEGRLIATAKRKDGSIVKLVLTPAEYREQSGPFLESRGFFEKEIARRVEEFGGIAHAFSTYESRMKAEDEKPFARGINSIQLWNDGKRWWILSICWSEEGPGLPLPAKYLKDGK